MFPSLWTDTESGEGEEYRPRPGVSSISCPKAQKLIASGKCALIDVREPSEYAQGYIEGAVNWPLDRISAASAAQMLPERSKPVVVYCLTGKRAQEAALKLQALGYRYILNLGGISKWPYATVHP
ncbi:MAG: rhodanese-like domain-containing protein [Succinivibrio sp.]|jgi:phage shock protein E|nr:rhodanese-like domain-containing protein [Succinivibrio sp.]